MADEGGGPSFGGAVFRDEEGTEIEGHRTAEEAEEYMRRSLHVSILQQGLLVDSGGGPPVPPTDVS